MTHELETIKNKLLKSNKEVDSLRDECANLKNTKESYKKKYLERNSEYKTLLKLNQDFQYTMIETMKEKDGEDNIFLHYLFI